MRVNSARETAEDQDTEWVSDSYSTDSWQTLSAQLNVTETVATLDADWTLEASNDGQNWESIANLHTFGGSAFKTAPTLDVSTQFVRFKLTINAGECDLTLILNAKSFGD